MRENRLQRSGRTAGPWSTDGCRIPSSFSAEVMAHQGFDSLAVDMQHGVVDYQAP